MNRLYRRFALHPVPIKLIGTGRIPPHGRDSEKKGATGVSPWGFTVFVFFVSCIFFLAGCETLKRKFTRKKKTKGTEEVMVITPRDYSAHPLPNDVLYKQYFIYWKAWNQELVSSINDRLAYKKIMDCVDQALVNLKKMATYLKEEKSKELGVYIKKTEDLKTEIEEARVLPPFQMSSLKYTAERILSSVNRQFDLTKMRQYLK